MASNTVNVTIRMDAELKERAEDFFAGLGMSLSTAINIFIRQCLREDKIPFQVGYTAPSKAAMGVIYEAERLARDLEQKEYDDVEEALQALKKDD